MKFRRLFVLVLILTCLSMVNQPSMAETTTHTFTATADTFTNDDNPGTNYGTSLTLGVASSAGIEAHTLLFFDLSSIAGRVVTQANLTIEISTMQASSTYLVSAAIAAWSEGGVTWITEPSTHLTPTATGLTAVGNVTINVTLIVASWMTGAITNYGVILTAPIGYYNLYSRENVGTLKPTLTVVSEPGPGIPSVGFLWIVGVILTIGCIYYLSQRTQINPLKESTLS